MELARSTAAAPALNLDPKRIAATSVAIAVHAVVLMVLMLPVQMAAAPLAEETVMQVIPIERIIPPPDPPPTREPVHRVTTATPQPHPTVVPQINNDPRPTDPHDENIVVDQPPETSFNQVEPQPSFAQIRASLSPSLPYPAQALRMRQSGQVMLKLLVNEQGVAIQGEIESSSGSRILDETALKFVLKRWRFFPAQQGGQNIQAWVLLPISFELPN
jgi:protein TonB